MRAPMPNQKLLSRVKLFCMRVEEGLHGCGLYHSYGVNLQHKNNKEIGNGAHIRARPPTDAHHRPGRNKEKVFHLAITKSTQLTPVQASSTYIQMSGDRGFRKEKTPGLVPLGLR